MHLTDYNMVNFTVLPIYQALLSCIMLRPANHADSRQIMSFSKCLSLEVSTYFHMQMKLRVSFS